MIKAFSYDLEAATKHYINHGMREGRAKYRFDPTAYLIDALPINREILGSASPLNLDTL
jgi:hypothetical protein